MPRLSELLGLGRPLDGLEEILAQVADGRLSQEDAARQIRQLAKRIYIPPWFSRLFKLMGAAFALVGVGFALHSVSFAVGTQEVPGTVIQMVGDSQQSPFVEYTVHGKRFTLEGSVSSFPPAYSVGEKVTVLCRNGNPSKAQIDSFTERWLLPVVFTAGGIIGMVIGAFYQRIMDWLTNAI